MMAGLQSPTRLNRPEVLDAIEVVTFVLVALLLIIAALTLPAAVTGANNSQAQKQSDDLNACRAEFRGAIDDANIALAKARTRVDLLTSEGLQASVQKDEAALAEVIRQGPAARRAIEEATEQLDRATLRYQEAVTESRLHKSEFLRRCKDG